MNFKAEATVKKKGGKYYVEIWLWRNRNPNAKLWHKRNEAFCD